MALATPKQPKKKDREKEEPISTIAAKIVQMAVRDDVSLADLGKLAEGDPAFAMRVLALVNSPAFGLPSRVSNTPQAVSLLGIRGLRNLALSLSLSDMVPLGEDGEVLLAISLRRAVTARLIAEHLGEKQTDEYFTAGLFLEAGLLARARLDLAGAASVARVPSAARVSLERAKGEKDHPTRGAEVAKGFQLPERTVAAIARHHDPTPPDERLPRIAWVAERVSAAYEGGNLDRNRADALEALTLVEMRGDAADRLLREIPEKVAASASAFEREVGAQKNLDELTRDANSALVALNHNYEEVVRTLNKLVHEKEELMAQIKEANSRLEKLAATDALTGLMNRRSFMDAMKRDLARADRGEQWLSVIMSDVDHFKKVNDTYGHQTGDDVLKLVSRVYTSALRQGDIPGRYGGEEFVVLLPQTDPQGAAVVAERVRAQLEATPAESAQGPFKVTASFGVACVKGPGCIGHGERVIARADEALYEAKHGGRNRVVVVREPVNA